jgi:hypothetical protein
MTDEWERVRIILYGHHTKNHVCVHMYENRAKNFCPNRFPGFWVSEEHNRKMNCCAPMLFENFGSPSVLDRQDGTVPRHIGMYP